jgi:hypothetical protein
LNDRLALADAQSLAIRKLLSKSAYDSNIAPGPPLPTSHPSPALLAKLHLECASLYSSALSLVKAVGARKRPSSSSDSSGEVSADLRRYLGDEAAFHSALARKWIGVDAGENGGVERGGEAVGFMGLAKKELEELKDSKKGINMGKGDRGMKDRMKEKVNDELEKVNLFFKHYKKVNDSVSIPLPGFCSKFEGRHVAPFPACSYAGGAASSDTRWANGCGYKTLPACGAGIWTWFCGLYPITN